MVYVLRVCVGCTFCVSVLWCAVLCRYVWCWCWCWCVVFGVCVCGVCGVWCVLYVCGVCCLCAARHVEKNPCASSKRLRVQVSKRFRVYLQDARMSHTAFFLLSFSLLFSLSNNGNDHSSSRFSLCTLRVSECTYIGSFPVWRTCSHGARNNCPGITVQASCHLE